MFIFFSKLLPLLFYPVSLSCLLLAAALRTRSSKWKRRLTVSALALLFLLGNGWVSSTLVRSLEWQYLPPDEYPTVDAIVVLGGGTLPEEYPRPFVEVNGSGDRVIHGARLFREGKAPLMILTGGNLPWEDAQTSAADDMLELVELLGVPPEAVLLESQSDNTYENALFTRELAEPLGVDRILLVTSALHMPRAVPLFENQGFEVIPAPADFNSTRQTASRPFSETWPDTLLSLFPSPFALAETTAALKEYFGIAVYWLRGWW